jgi:hypothetical protein
MKVMKVMRANSRKMEVVEFIITTHVKAIDTQLSLEFYVREDFTIK